MKRDVQYLCAIFVILVFRVCNIIVRGTRLNIVKCLCNVKVDDLER